MNKADPRRRLLQILKENLNRRTDISIADLDAIETLAEICAEQLPERFFTIVDSFHEDGGNLELIFERLHNIVQVSIEFPLETWGIADEALIPSFALDESDCERVMTLCGGMRKILVSSNDFDRPHKVRILNRIAAIEAELHKEKGRLDVVLAGVVDVGDALGKFGEKVEPLVKRMKEIAEIAKRSSREYDQLPSPDETKKLPAPEKPEG